MAEHETANDRFKRGFASWFWAGLTLATLLHAHHAEHGRPIVVVMAYVDALYDTADWFRQLWAESLGKDGQGTLPANSLGTVGR